MRSITLTAVFLVGVMGGTLCLAQPYRCDWSANGIAGGEMSSATLRVGATAGIPAGYLIGSGLQALIGFWQTDAQVGIREATQWTSGQALQTRLEAVVPNPSCGDVTIRYALAADGPVSLTVHDLTGRMVRTLVAPGAKRGAYNVVWDGCGSRGRRLAEGVYFVRLVAGGLRSTEKVLLAE